MQQAAEEMPPTLGAEFHDVAGVQDPLDGQLPLVRRNGEGVVKKIQRLCCGHRFSESDSANRGGCEIFQQGHEISNEFFNDGLGGSLIAGDCLGGFGDELG